MKKLARSLVAAILGWQVRRLRSKNDFKVIAVAGSIGKTSTKLAIAQVLKAGLKVQFQDGNYNDLVSVPLIFFGQQLPSLFNPVAWLAVFWRNEQLLRARYPYDVVVVELGTDQPGDIGEFGRYLKVDIGVIAAITPEHMEFFKDLDAVASEELALADMSSLLLINKDLSPAKYLDKITASLLTYGVRQSADFQLTNAVFSDEKCSFDFLRADKLFLQANHELVAEPQLYSVAAAMAVASELGLGAAAIKKGLANIHPVSGRMQRLGGVNNSVIIDDTYNASPQAVKAALDTLYRIKASHKIAILGNMNELGRYSEKAHMQIGGYCDPAKLDLVVTIGPDANEFLAAAAEKKGCKVQSFESPYTLGEYLKPIIKENTVILAKGSQNRVFAEEAVKQLLANPADQSKLVRQSKEWLKIKQKAFN